MLETAITITSPFIFFGLAATLSKKKKSSVNPRKKKCRNPFRVIVTGNNVRLTRPVRYRNPQGRYSEKKMGTTFA